MTTLAAIKEALIEDLRTLDPCRSVDWTLVIHLAKERGVKVTRQWLSKDIEIHAAYKEALFRHRKKGNRDASSSRKPKDLVAALERIEALKADVARRDETIALYDKRFIKYLNNARKKDISIADLEAD